MIKARLPFRPMLLALLLVSAAACSAMRAYESMGQSMDDSIIAAKVKARLDEDPLLHSYDIAVGMQDGILHLQGFVDTPRISDRAVRIARYAEGAQIVVSDLATSP